MRIAIVGTGIAGNVVARALRNEHDITVFEKNDRVGGHTNTVEVEDKESGALAVDTGFIVFNDRTYPSFNRLLDEIGQPWQPSVMSFSVQNEASGLEYNGSTPSGLFAQRRNLLKPTFLRMLRDIVRFNRDAPGALDEDGGTRSIADYVDAERYSTRFFEDYLRPMAAAIWSSEPRAVGDMPIEFLVRFFQHHGLLQLRDRPRWRVIKGGSREYVRRLTAGHIDCIRLSTPVQTITRTDSGVNIIAKGCAPERFDRVFLACHADEALSMLTDPSDTETAVLGAFGFQSNDAVLHTDERMMPRSRRAWAAWNYHVPATERSQVAVTYNMNILQGLPTKTQYCVTLNRSERIDPSKVCYRTTYAHPIVNARSVAAQRRHRDVNGARCTYYCGAYWRNGFHEDGVVSALDALQHFEEEQRGELHFRRTG